MAPAPREVGRCKHCKRPLIDEGWGEALRDPDGDPNCFDAPRTTITSTVEMAGLHELEKTP